MGTRNILVTGAAGFLGQRLIEVLLRPDSTFSQVASIIALDLAECPLDDPKVESVTGSIADSDHVQAIMQDIDIVFHLAAVLSGESEDDFDLGMRVNVDATRNLLEACRAQNNVPRFVFASSVAVFGGDLPDVVPENMALFPASSYGIEKAIGELLVGEYTRKGFVDGIVCRLPTIAVRPGRPNSAASSFVSGIIREPLSGINSNCPVPLDTRLWISSPNTAVRNLTHAATLSAAMLQGPNGVNLPGLCITAGEMLSTLERLGGAAARARVSCQTDQRIMDIVCSWPGAFDISRALRLGFSSDPDFDSIVRQFLAEQGVSVR